MSKRAAIFAGQGAQAPGMGRDLAEAFPECLDLYRKADEVLGLGLSKLCFEGPVEELTKSSNCQPAIFVTSVACFKALALRKGAVLFEGSAGLSLGEWSALYSAGCLSFEDTLRVLQARGRFMQEACEAKAGGMVSVIGLSADKLDAVCRATGVEPANFNSPEQTVLSGEKAAIVEAEKMAQAEGAKKTVVLNVAGAFHSALMAPAAKKLEEYLAGVTIGEPVFPVVSNVTGQPHGSAAEIRSNMVRQVTSPVKWVSCVEWFRGRGVSGYVEFGPGKVLSGLIKRIDSTAVLNNIQDFQTLEKTSAGL